MRRRGPTGSWWRALTAAVAVVLVPTVLSVQHTAAAAPSRYEAESATIAQGVVEANHAGFSGTGFVNLDNVVGSYVEFGVNAASAGNGTLAVRFANGTTVNRPMDIEVNGSPVIAAQSFPGTGAWTTWQTVTITAPLRAGANTVRLTSTSADGGPNIDALDVEVAATTDYQAENAHIEQGVVGPNHDVLKVGAPADTEHPTPPGQPACDDISFDSLTLSWPPSSDNIGVVAYDIYFLGQKVAEAPRSPFRVTGLQPNFEYRFSVFGRDAAGNESDSSPEVVCTTTADPGDPRSEERRVG